MSLFSRLFRPDPGSDDFGPDRAARPAPSEMLYVIGDIHGRADLLDRLLAKIENDRCGEPAKVIAVGDYVDRGEDSAGVLDRLLALSSSAEMCCLGGNHEEMLLDFLDAPERSGRRWLQSGGLQTLASFGVGHVSETSGSADLNRARDHLAVQIGPTMRDWLGKLPRVWQSGTVVIAHAGMNPGADVVAQDPRDLVWGHPEFRRKRRQDGLWVVHGHWVVEAPQIRESRIAIDTGACYSGRLTAAVIPRDGKVRFLHT